jgi:hypothetical protein
MLSETIYYIGIKMPLKAGSRAAHLAAVRAAKTRWGGKAGKKTKGKKGRKKGKMSHAERSAAARKAARKRNKS